MAGRHSDPLSAHLSQLLVAFTIEVDNEFERLMPHRTSRYGSTPGLSNPPWLVSLPMWALCLQHVSADGIRAADLVRRSQLIAASMKLLITRLSTWWGYLEVATAPKPADRLVRLTAAGHRAHAVWTPLPEAVETAWRARFGSTAINRLRNALGAVACRFEVEMPNYLPVGAARLAPHIGATTPSVANLPLHTLVSRVLLAYALDFDQVADLSLSQHTATPTARLGVSANLLRVLAQGDAVPARELPRRTGVDESAVGNWLKALERYGYATTGRDRSGTRARAVTLTARGREAAQTYADWTNQIGPRWDRRFGASTVRELRDAVTTLVDGGPPLFGLPVYAEGWRAREGPREVLPHYPVVSHRGGFPDGS
jgi:DNA-binding MarR family transcriptional regulator